MERCLDSGFAKKCLESVAESLKIAKASYGACDGALESSGLRLVGSFNRSKKDSKLVKREHQTYHEFFYQQKTAIFVLTITIGFPIEKPPMAAFFGRVGSFSIGNHTVISHFQNFWKSNSLCSRGSRFASFESFFDRLKDPTRPRPELFNAPSYVP